MAENTEKNAAGRKGLKAFFLRFFSKDAAEGFVPNRELFAYGAALTGQNMDYNLVAGWMFYFCINVLKIDPIYVGTITLVSRAWDGFNDPIVGTLIDRIPTKNGYKLHRYLGKLALLIGFLTVLLFCDPGFGQTGKIVWASVIYFLWDLCYSFQDVGLWGTLPLISPHSEERARAAQWVTIGASCGGAIVGLMPALMGAARKIDLSEKRLFFICALVFGLVGEAISTLALKTRERVFHPDADRSESFFKQLFEIRRNKILIALFLAQTLAGLSLTLPWIYFFKYCVEYTVGGNPVNGETVMFYYGIVTGAPGAFCMLIATKLMKKLGGPKRALMINQIILIFVRLVCYFIGYKTISQMAVVSLLMAASSVISGITGIVNRSFLCDSIDYMEWKTGKRTEGVASSMQNFVTKLGAALQGFINGFILDALRFDNSLEGITGQPDAFYKWQWPLFILGPAVGSLLYLIPMIDRKSVV